MKLITGMKSNKRLKTFNTEMKREMKTPVKELYEKLWEADKDRFAWNAILMDMLEKEKEFIRKIYWEGGQDVPQHSSMVDAWYNETFNTNEK